MRVMNTTFKSDTRYEDFIINKDAPGFLVSVQVSSDDEIDSFLQALAQEIPTTGEIGSASTVNEDDSLLDVVYQSPRLADWYELGQETDYEHRPFFDILVKGEEAWERFRKFFKDYIIANAYITCPFVTLVKKEA